MTTIRNPFSVATRLAALVTITSLLSTCGSTDPEFEEGVIISVEDYEISDLACDSRIAQAVVDGELVDEVQWWGQGTITNLLPNASVNYDLRYKATFDDGTTTEDARGDLILPLESGGSTDFSFLVSPVAKTPIDCSVFLYDSVLNWGG